MVSAVDMPDGATMAGIVVRYRKRAIGAEELSFLRKTIDDVGEKGRVLLSQTICEAWNWRQANGELSLAACRDLLNRLDEWGYIKLPAKEVLHSSRSEGWGGKPLIPREWIPLAWYPLGPGDVSLRDVQVRPIVAEEADGWRLFMERYHYLGAKRMVGENLRYVATARAELVALLGFGAAALHVPSRDTFIGWSEQRKREALHFVACNHRYLVMPWIRRRLLASKVLSLCLRRLSADWVQRWGHPLYLAETFVDQRFRGVCYRASNWQLLGQTAGRRKSGNSYLYDSTPKSIYVYPLERRACDLLCGRGL